MKPMLMFGLIMFTTLCHIGRRKAVSVFMTAHNGVLCCCSIRFVYLLYSIIDEYFINNIVNYLLYPKFTSDVII